MASSDAFGLRKKLTTEENQHSSPDPILDKFNAIVKNLELYTRRESILSFYYQLYEIHTEWQDLKEKNKSIKRVCSFHNAAQTNEESAILPRLTNIENQVLQDSSRQTNLPLWDDRYTSFKPHPNTCIEDDSDEREQRMVDWLLKSSGYDFTAIGIYGMGCSGKTALVKNVLKQKTVGDKFKCIIWANLSQLTCKEEIDDWIVKYLLYRLGLDTDSLAGDMDENKDFLMEELERRLLKSGNYILVLDDMWCSEWFADFLGKLKKIRGGAVIVTSRRKTVAEKIGDKNRLIHLNPRDYKESAFLKDGAKDLGT